MNYDLLADKLLEEMFMEDDYVICTYDISCFNDSLTTNKNAPDPNLYCYCSNPRLVKSQAGGEAFDYCRGCKKEKL